MKQRCNDADVYKFLLKIIDTQDLKALKLLPIENFDPNIVDHDGRNILIELIEKCSTCYNSDRTKCEKSQHKKEYNFYLEVIKFLLMAGADTNSSMLLHRVVIKGNLDVLNFMLEPNICKVKLDINVADNMGNTALHIAAKNRKVDVIKRLLKTDIRLEDLNKAKKPHFNQLLCNKNLIMI